MLTNQPHQRNKANLGIDIERGKAEIDKYQRAKQSQRYRNQNHNRVTETFKLGGQYQKDNQNGKEHGDQESTGLIHELP